MAKKPHLSFMFLSLALVVFFAIVSGGCGGGGSSGSIGGGANDTVEIPTNPVPENESAARAETVFTFNTSTLTSVNSMSIDADSNGKPDFLDFYGIPQYHVSNSASGASVTAAHEMPLVETAEMGVNVPSMIWLNRLNTEAEGGNIFIVPLTAGQEYTFELSKNLTEGLGGILPNISFYDPSNHYNSLDDAEEMSNVTIAAYPKENPSIVCYTIKPEVSGNYIVKITNGDPYVGAYLDDNGNLAHYSEEKTDTASVLFIYKERRNEAGETGYYTRFKFKIDSNKTETISISDIIELRKIFFEAYPKYFEEVYGQNLDDNDYGKGNDFNWNNIKDTLSKEQAKALETYAYYIEEVLAEIGIVALFSNPYEALDNDASLDSLSDEELEAKYEEAYAENKLMRDILEKFVYGNSAVSISAVTDDWSSIPVDITGIPYEPRYYMGRGAMAFTMLDPPGAVTIRLENPTSPTDAQKKLAQFDAATSDDLMKSADLLPKASDTNDDHPITTDFYAKFIHTASQTEQLSKTTANVSLATSAFGASAGTGSTNNFKFGLTSSTFVIHYEETEVDYRDLPKETRYKAWENAELFEAIDEDYPEDKENGGEKFIREFRNDYGDYYVSGYQYGACYDAYIAITTQTSEQLDEVESKLAAGLNLDSVTASADLKNTTKNTLKENKATIDVRIVTSGFGNTAPTVIPPSNPGLKSGDVEAIDDVFTTLADFRSKIGKSANRASYAPVRVKMTRWKADPKISRRMRKKGYKSGNIPVTVAQSEKISAFNTQLKALRGYRNVVTGNSSINGTYKDPLDVRFNAVITRVSSWGDRFYLDSNKASFDETVTEVEDLTKGFKSLADRFTFYTKLVIAQKQEKETYDRLKKGADTSSEGSNVFYSYVRQMPFGKEGGGESGYSEYAVSEYVTADINAGIEVSKDVHADRSKASAYRLEWTSTGTQKDFPGADPASLTAATTDGSNAIFCKVWAHSNNRDSVDDRKREIVGGAPAVGKKYVGFHFMSGYSSSVDWEIIGKAMRFRTEDYPFVGLVTQ